MQTMPSHVLAYKKTPEFNQHAIPKGLLKDHNTKQGVWAKIVILSGTLEYTILEPELEVLLLSPEQHGVVEPTVLHYIKAVGEVRFYVEFYR